MKRLKLERGKEELNSTDGIHLCGHFLREPAREHLPKKTSKFAASIFAYVGAEGYMLDHELRRANSTVRKAPPQFIVECVEKLKALGLKGSCLIRLDSGNDAEENFAHFGQESFIIKRNLRRECPEQWLATARRVGEVKSDTGQGKNVYTVFVDHLCPGGAKSSMSPVSVAFEGIERLTDTDGKSLLIPTIE